MLALGHARCCRHVQQEAVNHIIRLDSGYWHQFIPLQKSAWEHLSTGLARIPLQKGSILLNELRWTLGNVNKWCSFSINSSFLIEVDIPLLLAKSAETLVLEQVVKRIKVWQKPSSLLLDRQTGDLEESLQPLLYCVLVDHSWCCSA